MSEQSAPVEASEATPAPAEAAAPVAAPSALAGAKDTGAVTQPSETEGSKPEVKSEDGHEATSEGTPDASAFEISINIPEGLVPDEARASQFKGTLGGLEKAVLAANGDPAKVRDAIAKTAQSLVDTEAAAYRQAESEISEQQVAAVKRWQEATRKDPEIGGADHSAKMAAVARARDAFMSQDLVDTLDSFGLGEHPEVLRHLYRIGLKITPDDPTGGGGAAPTREERTADIIYGTPR